MSVPVYIKKQQYGSCKPVENKYTKIMAEIENIDKKHSHFPQGQTLK